MDKEQERQPEGAPERAHHAGAGVPSGADASTPQRFSAARKVAAVTCLLRGEPLEVVARELNVTVARLSEWRERALAAAASVMKEREREPEGPAKLRAR